MKRLRKAIPLLLLLLFVGSVALAQSTAAISRWVIGGGGGTAIGGNVSISSTLGQAIAGPGRGRDVDLCVNLWCNEVTEHTVYLPAVVRNFFTYALPCGSANNYCEDYDSSESAYGPLEPGIAYSAYPDDRNDYYYFILPDSMIRSIEVRVTNYQAVGQVLVRDRSLGIVGRDERKSGEDYEMRVLIPNLLPGKYYIQLYTDLDKERNPSARYTLTVNY